ncbi:MAG: DUF5906 domain-containing protein [Campylobacterales bacterium]|nr:DUF5906 domain-containing protein [Campylobacterales bacterium]
MFEDMELPSPKTFEIKGLEEVRKCSDIVAGTAPFIANNWLKEGVENSTLNEIKSRGGAVWLSSDGDIMFRSSPVGKIVKLDNTKARNVIANFLGRESVRLLNGTQEKAPDFYPNEILSVSDRFTPFTDSEFVEIDGLMYRTPWKPTTFMSANPSDTMPPNIKMLLERLTNHKPDQYQWVINWMAGFFQTRKRSQCALVLKGDQGSGKGILFEHIITPLFGEEYSIIVDDDRLQSNFKNWMSGQLFYNLNEISHDVKSRKSSKNFLKQLVTDTKVQAEQKYKDSGAIEIFGQVLVTSNELAPLEIETSDRRYTIMQTDKALKSDNINTAKLIGNIKNELMAFASFLKGVSVDWKLFNTAMDTKEKRAVVNATTDKVVLLGNAIKTCDASFFEPVEEFNPTVYIQICNNLSKGMFAQPHIRIAYNDIFDEEAKPRYLLDKLKTFDVSIFGELHKYNGLKCYKIKTA